MSQPAELNASILSNPEARRAYYDQRRANSEARERQTREANVVNLLANIAQFEIEKSTGQPMPADEVEKLRTRIKAAIGRMPTEAKA